MTIARLNVKTAALAAAATFLAMAGNVVAQASGNSTNVVASVWTITSKDDLDMLSPLFVLRKAPVDNARGHVPGVLFGMGATAGEVGGVEDEDGNVPTLVHNISFAALLGKAFDMDAIRVVLPESAPTNGFDLLMSGRFATRERLQAEIKRQLGYGAHTQSRPTDVLLLTLDHKGAAGFVVSEGVGRGTAIGHGSGGAGGSSGTMNMSSRSLSIPAFVTTLQGYFDKPILDRTGLTGDYDISIAFVWGNGTSRSEAILQTLPLQTGLALTPNREPVEMLIVERNSAY